MRIKGKMGRAPAGRGSAWYKSVWCAVEILGVIGLLLSAVGTSAQTPPQSKGSGNTPDKSLLEPLDQLIRQIEREFLQKDGGPASPLPTKTVECQTTEQLVAHFKQFEPQYLEIRQAIDQNSKQRVAILQDWRAAGLECNAKFKEANQAAMTSLKKLPIDSNQQELTKTESCIQVRRRQLETSLNTPGLLPQHIEKIAQNIDALRKLGSQMREMTMELGYFRDKRTRLSEEYEANLQRCP